jgi:hypothetical protein
MYRQANVALAIIEPLLLAASALCDYNEAARHDAE